jgi:predicted AAA+ superfamily ATPase
MTDLKRNLSDKVNQYLELFPAIVLLGVRQCGKTTLSRQLRPDWKYFDLEKSSDYDFITGDYDFFFREYPNSIIIDETQHDPQLFRELRGVIDADRKHNGRFILTGSSSPELISRITESLAGRIGIIEVGPMKMNELKAREIPGLYQILAEGIDSTTTGKILSMNPLFSRDEVLDKFLSGGYPHPVLQNKPELSRIWMENYFRTYLQQDIRSRFPKLNNTIYRRFIEMLSQLSGSIINRSDLGRTLNCSEVTVAQYLDIAEGTYIWRSLRSYERSISKSIVKKPKGHLRDSGLNLFLLGIDSREKLLRYPRAGNLFEAFVVEEILMGMESTLQSGWQSYYYRTKNGVEVDLVLEGTFGTLPIEIKLGETTGKGDIDGLKQFVNDNKLPLGLVVNTGTEIKLLTDGILQVPALWI